MKIHRIMSLALLLALGGCDRRASEAQRLAEERAALEREKAQLAADRAAADRAANEGERARLDSERAALELERAKLSSDREAQAKAEQNVRLAAEREKRLAAERRAAEESAARRQAELDAQEAQRVGERASADAKATQTVDFFYDALDPHGDWVEIERYGYAFRPRLGRNPQWRPYVDGGWIHTDYGWTWRSDEPFGWATYHYGRWTRIPRLGWVWIPGSEWGPAWVSWRRSDDHVGWAPLPPDAWSPSGFNAAVDSYFDIGPGLYVFVSVRDFAEPTYTGRVVQPEQNVTIINQTVNVTNVTYKTVNQQNIVVNNGPEISFVEQRGGRPVQRAKVERMAMKAPNEGQPAKLQGNVLRLAAPVLASKPTAAKPKAVKEQVKAEETDRGWEKSDAEAKARIRQQSQREARRAERRERGEPDNDGPTTEAPARRDAPAPASAPAPAAPQREPRQPAATPRQPETEQPPQLPGATGERSPRQPARDVLAPDTGRKPVTPLPNRGRPGIPPVRERAERPTPAPSTPPPTRQPEGTSATPPGSTATPPPAAQPPATPPPALTPVPPAPTPSLPPTAVSPATPADASTTETAPGETAGQSGRRRNPPRRGERGDLENAGRPRDRVPPTPTQGPREPTPQPETPGAKPTPR